MARKPNDDPKPSGFRSTETDHEKQKQSPQNTPRLRSITQDSPNLHSCTESKGFKVKVIGDGTDESYWRETTSKRTENKQMARKPKDDPKPLGIHSLHRD